MAKGFVGVHAALDTNYKWPEYGEMIGGWFDQHPWSTFNAPIINEDPNFPAVRHFPKAFVKYDEIYQPKEWSRDKVNVLLSLDPTKLNYANNPRVHRTDHDFAVAWDKMYGKGRVFYSTLGHTEEAWSDPDIRKMYFEAIKWVLGMTEGSTASHPRPQTPGGSSTEVRAMKFLSINSRRECALLAALLLVSLAVPRRKRQPPASQSGTSQSRHSCPRPNRIHRTLVQSGSALFRQDCSFCHGRDAGGGESGPGSHALKVGDRGCGWRQDRPRRAQRTPRQGHAAL